MQTVKGLRFSSCAYLVIIGALTLACDRDERSGPTLEVAVQGERVESQTAPAIEVAAAPPSESEATKSAETATPAVKDKSVSTKQSSGASQPSSVLKGSDAMEPPQVKRLVVARDVENREPVALGGAVQLGQPVLAFVELSHAGAEAAQIVVTFEHADGAKVGFVELDVPASSTRYRTWARTQNVKRAGEWQAVVTLKDGKELARQAFIVAAGDVGAS